MIFSNAFNFNIQPVLTPCALLLYSRSERNHFYQLPTDWPSKSVCEKMNEIKTTGRLFLI